MKYLSIGKYNKHELTKNLKFVQQISKYLCAEWKRKYTKNKWRKQESNIRARPVMKEPWKKEQKQEVIYIYNIQIARESFQLGKFTKKFNSKDELILAETIPVRSFEEKNNSNSYNFLIASCEWILCSTHA